MAWSAVGIQCNNAFQVLGRAWPRVSTQYMLAMILIVVWQPEADCIELGRMTFSWALSRFSKLNGLWFISCLLLFPQTLRCFFLYWEGSNDSRIKVIPKASEGPFSPLWVCVCLVEMIHCVHPLGKAIGCLATALQSELIYKVITHCTPES